MKKRWDWEEFIWGGLGSIGGLELFIYTILIAILLIIGLFNLIAYNYYFTLLFGVVICIIIYLKIKSKKL